MTRIDDAARVLDTVGLAAWFGGSLVGAVALANTSDDALQYEDEAWRRWSPVQTAAIAAHVAGSAKLATTNKGRLATQRGVPSVAIVKGVCTAAALGATVYASRLGRQAYQEAQQGDGDESAAPSATRRRLRKVQIAVPVLTGAMLVADARLGEQQRPAQVIKGAVERLVPDALQSLPEAIHSVPDALRSIPDVLEAMPIADTSRDLVSKAGELGRAASPAITQPIRQALHH
jgi:hypothetical protein